MSATNGFAVTILAGCNGVEAMIVLLAAMLAYPAPWKRRLIGLLVGALIVWLVWLRTLPPAQPQVPASA